MRVFMFLSAVVAATALRGAVPTVSNVTVADAPDSRALTVSYDLAGADGIVTFDVLTNGVSIGGASLTGVAGDINARVASGEGRSFSWRPDKAWPANGFDSAAVSVAVTAWATNAPPTYMVIDLASGIKRFYADKAQIPGGLAAQVYKTDKLLMRKIPAANVTWHMGSTAATDPNRQSDREQYHAVTLSDDYYIAVYPITNGQLTYCYYNHDTWKYTGPADAPVTNLIWNMSRGGTWPDGQPDAKSSVAILAEISGIPTFELPTDAQWEFACRAGTPTPFNDLAAADVGWSKADGVASAQPVGRKQPNAWGLYDMHGNVWEWCRDWYQAAAYAEGAVVTNPPGPASGTYNYRCWRGGTYASDAKRTSSSTRSGAPTWSLQPNSGFRPVCAAVIP